jgi:UDP-N-acetylglucosamine kinase
MNTNFDISEEEVRKIFTEILLPETIEGIVPNSRKEAVILGGQPGSGKSALARILLQKNSNMVFINGDDIRAYHPKYFAYLKENDIEAADKTQKVCNFWIEQLVIECIKKELDFIVEGTLRTSSGPLDTAKKAHENGYAVSMALVATTKEESLATLAIRKKKVMMKHF